MSEIYTPTIFDLFQKEYELFEACSIKSMNVQTSSIEYVIVMARNLGEWQVFFDFDKKSIFCSCRKFENFGILCCHCLKVFIHMDVRSVPEPYILKRWTKSARSEASPTVDLSHVVGDVDLSPKQRYQKICPHLIRIASESCRSPKAFIFLSKVVDELDRQILQFQNSQVSDAQMNEFLGKVKGIESSIDGSTQVKGFAKRESKKGTKRKKGFQERKRTKQKKDGSSASQIKNQAQRKVKGQLPKKGKSGGLSDSQGQVQYEVPNTSAPIGLNDENNGTLSPFGVANFTNLLMGNLHMDNTTLIDP